MPDFTQEELAAQLQHLFEGRGFVTKDEIIRELTRRHAPVAMTLLLDERLPRELRIGELRPLWEYLHDVPLRR